MAFGPSPRRLSKPERARRRAAQRRRAARAERERANQALQAELLDPVDYRPNVVRIDRRSKGSPS